MSHHWNPDNPFKYPTSEELSQFREADASPEERLTFNRFEPLHAFFGSRSGSFKNAAELPSHLNGNAPGFQNRADRIQRASLPGIQHPRIKNPNRRMGYTDHSAVDMTNVRDAVHDPDFPLTEVDPRQVHAAQAGTTRQGVEYYLGDKYWKTGQTFADADQAGNRVPVVYQRRDQRNVLLSGHHRAIAANLMGKQFPAKIVTGSK